MKHTASILVSTAAATALAAPGLALAATNPVAAAPDDTQAAWTSVEATGHHAGELTQVAGVSGKFSCDQEYLTPASVISSVFMKAASVMCQSAADSTMIPTAVDGYTVVHDGKAVFVEASGDGDEQQTKIMGCACSSNVPGGSAIVNAQVSGVSVEQLAETL